MTVRHVAFVRTYQLPAGVLGGPSKPAPAWYHDCLDTRYATDERLRWREMDRLPGVAFDRPVELRRFVVELRHLGMADCILSVEGQDLDERLLDCGRPRMFESAAISVPNRWSGLQTLSELWDATVREAAGDPGLRLPPEWKTGFGVVALIAGEPAVPDGGLELVTAGLEPHERLVAGRNRLVVHVPSDATAGRTPPGYLVLAGLCARSRHLVGQLGRRMEALAFDCAAGEDPWRALARATEIQRDAIIIRRELAGAILGSESLASLFGAIRERACLNRLEQEQLEASLQGLDSLSSGLLSAAIDRSQRRFGVFGLYFAVFSVAFAAFGVVSVERAGPSYRVAVAVALLAIAGIGLFMRWQYDRFFARSRA